MHVLIIGNFDGMHHGHQLLIQYARYFVDKTSDIQYFDMASHDSISRDKKQNLSHHILQDFIQKTRKPLSNQIILDLFSRYAHTSTPTHPIHMDDLSKYAPIMGNQPCISMLSFAPHPRAFFQSLDTGAAHSENHHDFFRLSTDKTRAALAQFYGADQLLHLSFDKELMALTPDAFFDQCIVPLSPDVVITGTDFCFGHQRSGNIHDLCRLSQGHEKATSHKIAICPIDLLTDIGRASGQIPTPAAVSSSQIRAHIKTGDVKKAHALLGHFFYLEGVVKKGRQLARKLGFPTANIDLYPDHDHPKAQKNTALDNLICPKYGVYTAMVRAIEKDGTNANTKRMQPQPAIINIGVKPTINKVRGEGGSGSESEAPPPLPTLEAHILGDALKLSHDTLYGKKIQVFLLDFIRGEQKFDSVDALQAQIKRDIEKAHIMLKDLTCPWQNSGNRGQNSS